MNRLSQLAVRALCLSAVLLAGCATDGFRDLASAPPPSDRMDVTMGSYGQAPKPQWWRGTAAADTAARMTDDEATSAAPWVRPVAPTRTRSSVPPRGAGWPRGQRRCRLCAAAPTCSAPPAADGPDWCGAHPVPLSARPPYPTVDVGQGRQCQERGGGCCGGGGGGCSGDGGGDGGRAAGRPCRR